MKKAGLTSVELLVAVVVTALLGVLLWYVIPLAAEWQAQHEHQQRIAKEQREKEFCTAHEHKGTTKRVLGKNIYCDHRLIQWTETIGLYDWGRANLECERLNYGGENNWRLPTTEELRNGLGVCACDWPQSDGSGQCPGCSPCQPSWDSSAESFIYWTLSGSNIDYKETVWFSNGNEAEAHILQRTHTRCVLDE